MASEATPLRLARGSNLRGAIDDTPNTVYVYRGASSYTDSASADGASAWDTDFDEEAVAVGEDEDGFDMWKAEPEADAPKGCCARCCGRSARAWSLGANCRSLCYRRSTDLTAVDGLRAFAILWLLFHNGE